MASWRLSSDPAFLRVSAVQTCLLFWAFLAASAATGADVGLRDDRGVHVRLAAPAQRIVALAPNLVELTYAAGAGRRLVGVALYSDYPEDARHVTQVGDAARVDLERIMALDPDLVLAWKSGNQAGDIEKLEGLGITVFVTEPVRISDIPRLLRTIGVLAGTGADAERAAQGFEQGTRSLRQNHAEARHVRVLYEVWHRPLITVSGGHIISDVIALCGGVNVFGAAPGLTPSVSLEAVVAARAEVVLGGARTGGEAELRRDWREAPVSSLRALPVFYVDPDLIQRQTPRILEGARIVCAALDSVRTGK